MRVELTEFAERLTVDVEIWSEEQEPGAGRYFIERFEEALWLLQQPLATSVRKVFGDVRRVRVPRFPAAIFSFVETERVVVIAVVDQRRSPAAIRRILRVARLAD